MAFEPTDIGELGESLIQSRRRDRRKAQKKQERNAWKIGLATAGVKMLNRTLASRADQFLQSEPVMAAKGRYKSAAMQAQRVLGMQADAAEQGITMEEYFFQNRYLPEYTAQFESVHGKDFRSDTYMSQIREQAMAASRREAIEFEEAVSMASRVPDYATVEKNINDLVSPPRNAGEALMGWVKGAFTDKSSEDIRKEVLDKIDKDGILRSDSYKDSFDRVLRDDGFDAAVEWANNIDPAELDSNAVKKQLFNLTPITSDGSITAITTEVTEYPDGRLEVGESKATTLKAGNVKELALRVEEKHRRDTDLIGISRDFLTSEGMSILAKATDNINMSNIHEEQNFSQYSTELQKLLQNPRYIKDDSKARRDVDTLNTVLQMQELNFSAAAAEDDPEVIMGLLQNAADLATELSRIITGQQGTATNFSDL